MRPLSLSFLLALLGAGLVLSPVRAAPIPWSNPNGSTPSFDWSNGSNDNGIFGDPVAVGDSLVFFPSNFKAHSANGVAGSISDKINVDIQMHVGVPLTQITVQELGDYGITGSATPAGNSVNVVATLITTNLLQVLPPVATSLTFNPAMPITTLGSGQWQGNAVQNFTPGEYVRFHLTLDDLLQATTNANSVADIEKKIGTIVIHIPEPATIGLLLCGAPLMLRRRRGH
ncbi:MAG TPA: hypothetical protein VH518_01640 [Tepidisphaeraceae bacterium]|jgi:hypothetical protein